MNTVEKITTLYSLFEYLPSGRYGLTLITPDIGYVATNTENPCIEILWASFTDGVRLLTERIREGPQEDLPYTVEVCRTSYAYRTYTIVAQSLSEAQNKAIEQAMNDTFVEKDADYSIE